MHLRRRGKCGAHPPIQALASYNIEEEVSHSINAFGHITGTQVHLTPIDMGIS